jgi:predicted HTH transcriptional regulator
MNETQFLVLMDQPESVSLDFKRELWDLKNDDGKSKLIKDVVSMANAERAEPAHILVGVNMGPGGTRTLASLTRHVDDAALQQIVRGKVDPAPTFLYRELTVRGAVVGVLSVPVSLHARAGPRLPLLDTGLPELL